MKPIDISKITKSIAKTNSSISVGFTNPKTWIHTGNYALNYRISGKFKQGFPLEGKMTLLAGDSGTGKSYIASGNVVKWCQDNNVLPVIIDTENALDKDWMDKFDIDSDGYVVKVSASLIDDIAKILSDFISNYKKDYGDLEYDERPKVLFIIDSLGMAITPTDADQFQSGDMKGDMGRKQKQIYSLCRNFMASCSAEPIGMLATQHTYASQNMFDPDAVIAGGKGLEFTPSVVVAMTKRKLKEDENGTKTTDVQGIKVAATVRKTRYTQPFQRIDFTIPWDTGMNPYSGLFDLFSESYKVNNKPVLVREGNQYAYYSVLTGELIFKKFRKDISSTEFETIMDEIDKIDESLISSNVEETIEEETSTKTKKSKKTLLNEVSDDVEVGE